MITQKDIPTFLINLKRRSDRLEHARKQLDYIGWQYEVFEAIDTNSYEGCGLSHLAIAEIAYKNNYEYVIALEDDIFTMPYAEKLWNLCLSELMGLDWEFFNITPTIHRPLNNFQKYLMDLTNLPFNPNDHHQAKIFGTTGLMYKSTMYERLLGWHEVHRENFSPIDMFLANNIYPNVKSFSPMYPIFTQYTNISDINGTVDSNNYLMTYNWNLYTENKLPGAYMDIDFLEKCKTDDLCKQESENLLNDK